MVMLLLDAMPTLAHSTKASALLLFLANVVLVWFTDRFVLMTELRPQVQLECLCYKLTILTIFLFLFFYITDDVHCI